MAPCWSRRLMLPPSGDLYWCLQSTWLARGLYVVASLGIADLLKDGPRNIKDLAEATQSHEKSLYRVLRMLAAFGIFDERKPEVFQLTSSSRCLLSDAQNSLKYWAIQTGHEGWIASTAVLESVKNGRSGLQNVRGQNLWEFYQEFPEAHKNFVQGMDAFSEWQCNEIVPAYPFGKFKKLVDVGGGRGSMISRVLKEHPHLKGVLYDQPATIEQAKPFFEKLGLTQRCELIGGSFLDSVPSGADGYMLKHVLHDWDDENVVRILKSCRNAMSSEATLLVVNGVIRQGNNTDRLMKLNDVQAMLELGGGVRTLEDFKRLFQLAGLKLIGYTSTTILDASILEVKTI